MIGQQLPQTNENATVSQKNFGLELNKALIKIFYGISILKEGIKTILEKCASLNQNAPT